MMITTSNILFMAGLFLIAHGLFLYGLLRFHAIKRQKLAEKRRKLAEKRTKGRSFDFEVWVDD